MTVSDVLQRITTALEQSDVAYMLTGSFASAFYGTPRSTQDIDVAAILRIRRETFDRAYVESWAKELRLEEEWQKAESAAQI